MLQDQLSTQVPSTQVPSTQVPSTQVPRQGLSFPGRSPPAEGLPQPCLLITSYHNIRIYPFHPTGGILTSGIHLT